MSTESTVDQTPRTFSAAMTVLRERQKTSKGAPAYSRLVNRPVGRVFASVAYVLGRTPNQVTAVSATFTFGGIATIALVRPTVASSLAVALLLAIGYALDSADGQLARLRGGGSVVGEWLDHVVDAVKMSTLHLAVLVNWFRFSDGPDTDLLIPLAYQAVDTVMFFVIILNDQLRRAHRGTTKMLLAGDGTSSTLYSLAVIPTDYGVVCLMFTLMFWTTGFFWFYLGMLVANTAFLLLALVRWFREMKSY